MPNGISFALYVLTPEAGAEASFWERVGRRGLGAECGRVLKEDFAFRLLFKMPSTGLTALETNVRSQLHQAKLLAPDSMPCRAATVGELDAVLDSLLNCQRMYYAERELIALGDLYLLLKRLPPEQRVLTIRDDYLEVKDVDKLPFLCTLGKKVEGVRIEWIADSDKKCLGETECKKLIVEAKKCLPEIDWKYIRFRDCGLGNDRDSLRKSGIDHARWLLCGQFSAWVDVGFTGFHSHTLVGGPLPGSVRNKLVTYAQRARMRGTVITP